MAIFQQLQPFRCQNTRVNADSYPEAVDPKLVGTYSAVAKAGGGFVWDDVLEYRVWCHPERGSSDVEEGNDYYNLSRPTPKRLHFPDGPKALKHRSRSFDSLNTSTNLILASIVTLRKCASPNGQ